jgi:hypothetical protein
MMMMTTVNNVDVCVCNITGNSTSELTAKVFDTGDNDFVERNLHFHCARVKEREKEMMVWEVSHLR